MSEELPLTTGAGVSGYDAANNSPSRSSFLAFPTNSRVELKSSTRKQIVQGARALEANFPVVGYLRGFLAQRSAGRGIFPIAKTQDEEWNKLADRLIDEVGSNPNTYSIDGSCTLWEDQFLMAEMITGDGEIFEAFVKTKNGYPMVQPLDVWEIDSGYGDASGPEWEDGIKLSSYNKPIQYAVRELQKNGQYQDARKVDAINMVHIFQRRRRKQVRGFPWLYASLTHGTDALDLMALETATAKLHAALAVAVKRTGKKGRTGALGQIGGDKVSPDQTQALEKVFGGGMINYIGEDGEIQMISSSRPNVDLIQFCNSLIRSIAQGFRLPVEVVDMGALNGTAVRSVMEQAQSTCEQLQDLIVERHTRRWRTWRLWWAMQNGELPQCKDPSWWTAAYRGPVKLTVDLGRTAQASIDLVSSGLMSLDRYYAERNQDAKEELTAHFELVKWAMDEQERLGIPAQIIGQKTTQQMIINPAQETQE
jgi:capsid protein